MKFYFFATSLILSSFILSCGGNKEEKDESLAVPPNGIPAPQNNATDTSLLKPAIIPANNITTTTGTNNVNINPQNSVVTTTIPSTQAPVQTVSVGSNPNLNPPHGQPGHRCDISVGAPLNSKPAQPVTVAPTTNQAPPVITSQPVVQKVAPGMNPQHGQPGHRCDIAVGAPLNSKPAEPAAVTPAIVNPTISNPVKSDTARN